MSRYLVIHEELNTADFRLFCFPYTGGGAVIYRDWAPSFRPRIEIVAIQPPGRGPRWQEPNHQSLDELVSAIEDAMIPRLDRRYAFFGHSFGALVAFELTRRLRSSGHPLPQNVFMSGRIAPHFPGQRGPRYDLPQSQFVLELQRLGGIPDELLQDKEMMELILPPIRSDFQMLQTWRYREEPPLPVSIVAMGGTDDASVPAEMLIAWDIHSTKPVEVQLFAGGHFYVDENPNEVCQAILKSLVTS